MNIKTITRTARRNGLTVTISTDETGKECYTVVDNLDGGSEILKTTGKKELIAEIETIDEFEFYWRKGELKRMQAGQT